MNGGFQNEEKVNRAKSVDSALCIRASCQHPSMMHCGFARKGNWRAFLSYHALSEKTLSATVSLHQEIRGFLKNATSNCSNATADTLCSFRFCDILWLSDQGRASKAGTEQATAKALHTFETGKYPMG